MNQTRLKIIQVEGKIPTFIFFCNNPKYFHFSYKRYLENVIRENFGFDNCPINIVARNKRGMQIEQYYLLIPKALSKLTISGIFKLGIDLCTSLKLKQIN